MDDVHKYEALLRHIKQSAARAFRYPERDSVRLVQDRADAILSLNAAFAAYLQGDVYMPPRCLLYRYDRVVSKR